MNSFRFTRVTFSFAKVHPTAVKHSIFSYNPIQLSGRCESILPIHTSSISLQTSETTESQPPVRKYKKPVDWLPFSWHRRPMFNIFNKSGDTIKENIADPSLPRPGFELSDELKTADEKVKHMFSLATGKKGDMKEVCRQQVLKRIQRHPNDFTSLEVKIALMTIQIRGLFEHHKQRSKTEVIFSRIVLPIVIQKRNKLLNKLKKIDEERFRWLLDELQLYFEAPTLGLTPEKYCKKWDLRRLTKEYCETQIFDKKAAYHKELKDQQEAFLEEKKQILSWIEEEEKAIKAMNV